MYEAPPLEEDLKGVLFPIMRSIPPQVEGPPEIAPVKPPVGPSSQFGLHFYTCCKRFA